MASLSIVPNLPDKHSCGTIALSEALKRKSLVRSDLVSSLILLR
jgi:hypothetical protein